MDWESYVVGMQQYITTILEHIGFYKGLILLILGLTIFLSPEMFEIFWDYEISESKTRGLEVLGVLITTGGFLSLLGNTNNKVPQKNTNGSKNEKNLDDHGQ